MIVKKLHLDTKLTTYYAIVIFKKKSRFTIRKAGFKNTNILVTVSWILRQ